MEIISSLNESPELIAQEYLLVKCPYIGMALPQ